MSKEAGLPDYKGYVMSGSEKKKYYGVAAAGLFSLGYLFYHSLPLAFLIALLAFPGEKQYQLHLAEKRREALSIQFRDMLYSMSASVSAGRQLSKAVWEAKEQLAVAYGESSVLCRELQYMVHSMEESNEAVETLLYDFARRSHIEDIVQFVHICHICKKTGGDLDRVIEKTASVLMEKISVDRELQMITSQRRLEAKILTAIPVTMVFLLNLLSPDYLAILYEGIQGRIIMSLALMGIVGSYLISRRIAEISL